MQENNMEISRNKETFKLLQLSDDSKSLSDLELPDISNQRKRKVRRKTRPKSLGHRQQEVSSSNQCNRLILWIAIFLTCCWLLTLSYMIAVIHSENQRLEVQIKKQKLLEFQSIPLKCSHSDSSPIHATHPHFPDTRTMRLGSIKPLLRMHPLCQGYKFSVD